jgi:SAM-dependent methyltransferase
MSPVASSGGRSDRRAELLPAELVHFIDDLFVGSCDLFEEYVHRLVVQVVRNLGLDMAARTPKQPGEIAAQAGLDPVCAPVTVAWLLAMLASRGLAIQDGDGRYVVAETLPDLDPREVLEAQQRHDPSALASYRLAELAAELYPEVLRGTVSGEAALFGQERIGAWFDYFSNENVIYAINNRIGAIAAERALGRDGGAVLELGGGLASGTIAVLERCAEKGRLAAVRLYRFTEIAPSFLRRGQRTLAGKFPGVPLTFGRLDMDQPFTDAGIAEGAFALVYGVNTLHIARDLEFTLAEIRRALAPGGALVLSECVRPFSGRPVYVEFVFNLLDAYRTPRLVNPWRPNGGFLTPEHWAAALAACGFHNVAVYPDIARLREAYPSFVVAAISAVSA